MSTVLEIIEGCLYEDEKTYKVPQAAQSQAKKGIKLSKKHNMTKQTSGRRTAKQIASGEITAYWVKKIYAWFQRHSEYKDSHVPESDPDGPSNSWVSWLLWGSDTMKNWVEEIRPNIEESITNDKGYKTMSASMKILENSLNRVLQETEAGDDGTKAFAVTLSVTDEGEERRQDVGVRADTPEGAKNKALQAAKGMDLENPSVVDVKMVPNSDEAKHNMGSGKPEGEVQNIDGAMDNDDIDKMGETAGNFI